MDNLNKTIKEYLEKNNLTIDDFAKDIKIDKDKLNQFMLGKDKLSNEEIEMVNQKLGNEKMPRSKIIVKAIELTLKFAACVMALVTLLLCIMGSVATETLIALLSVGVVCATIPSLPKIER